MVPDDIELQARRLESVARSAVHAAAHYIDTGASHRCEADKAEGAATYHFGLAYGLAFRAAELRYDARGGMTDALERRRFEPGARWLWNGVALTAGDPWIDANGTLVTSLCDESRMYWVGCELMTRANGWLFLGLSDQGGYR